MVKAEVSITWAAVCPPTRTQRVPAMMPAPPSSSSSSRSFLTPCGGANTLLMSPGYVLVQASYFLSVPTYFPASCWKLQRG